MDPDYYLFSFTDTELLEIVTHPDEWGHLDYALAKKLLADRGKPVAPAAAEEYREERIKVLSRPERTHPQWIILGYVAAIAGSLFGFFIGYALACLKKTLPDGQRVYVYIPGERKHGRIILLISAIGFPFWLWGVLAHGV